MPGITLCAIMQNEEQFLPTFLDNVKDIFPYYVFVDGGSSDKSVELVESAGYKVSHIPFQMDFGAQKNNALDLAKTKWRMFIDIDETMSRGIKEMLLKFNPNSYYHHVISFFRDNYLDGGSQDDSPLDFPVRFFDDGVRYQGKVHEMPSYDTRTLVKFLGGRLYHRKDSYRQYRSNLIYELIRRGITTPPPPDQGAFNENGRLRLVRLLPDRNIEYLDKYLEGPLLNV